MHFHFDGQLLGCNWIKVKIPLWLFDINNDVITIRPGWYRIAHNVQKIIVKASRCLDTGKIINACCHTIC
jgi:hypothetical protein